jgi:pilus assembly protein CpaE
VATTVLVVDDDPNIQRVLTFTLKQEGFEVLVAADGPSALSTLADSKADLVLLDVTLPDTDGYELVAKIRASETGGRRVPVILLTTEANVSDRVRGLRAGADDDIIKPFHPAELIARVRALLARTGQLPAAPENEVRTLGQLAVFYGAKGGVGTTTIAINTAIALARDHQRRVGLVDANLQFGDHRVFLDLALDNKSIVNAFSEADLDPDLLRSMMVRHASGIELLLAPATPESADIVVETHRSNPQALTNVVELLRRMFDMTLVDTSKAIDDFNLHLFDAADVIYVVMTADLSCLKNVQLVLKTMDNLGYHRSKVKMILNRSSAYTGIRVESAEEVLGRPIDYQVINEYRGAISALNSGSPFMVSAPEGPLGRSVSSFASAVDQELAGAAALQAASA